MLKELVVTALHLTLEKEERTGNVIGSLLRKVLPFNKSLSVRFRRTSKKKEACEDSLVVSAMNASTILITSHCIRSCLIGSSLISASHSCSFWLYIGTFAVDDREDDSWRSKVLQ